MTQDSQTEYGDLDPGIKAMNRVFVYAWKFRCSEESTDLEFIVRDGKLRAHKFVFITVYPALKEILTLGSVDVETFILSYISVKELERALEDLYLHAKVSKMNFILSPILSGNHKNVLKGCKRRISSTQKDKMKKDEDEEKNEEEEKEESKCKVKRRRRENTPKESSSTFPEDEKKLSKLVEEEEEEEEKKEINDYHKCIICEQSGFVSRDELVKHKQREHGYSFFVCKQCSVVFKSRSAITSHLQECMPDGFPKRLDGRSVSCQMPSCDERPVCKCLKDLQNHLVSSHSSEIFSQECPFKDCQEKKNILKHIKMDHHKMEHYCPVDNIYFKTIRSLDNHWDRAHLGKKYRCLVCNHFHQKLFNGTNDLDLHLNKVHNLSLKDFFDESLLKDIKEKPSFGEESSVSEEGTSETKGRKNETEEEEEEEEDSGESVEKFKNKVNGKIFYVCNTTNCEFTTKSKKVMVVHRKTCKNQSNYSSNSLTSSNSSETQKSISCELCNENFISDLELLSHRRKAHPRQYYVCYTCPQKAEFLVKDLYIDHKKTCEPSFNANRFMCRSSLSKIFFCKFPDCTHSEDNWDHLSSHINSAHLPKEEKEGEESSGESVEKCSLCSSLSAPSFENRSGHLKHLRNAHHKLQYKCPECPNIVYAVISNLRSHFNEKHFGCRYRCNHCNSDFSGRKSLTHHVRLIHDQSIEKAACYVCGKVLINDRSLRSHLKIYHSEAVDIECKFCKLVFPNRAKLHHHKTRMHRKVKPSVKTPCPQCGLLVLKLKDHMDRVHPTNDPIQCLHCRRTCNNIHTLQKHLTRSHGMKKISISKLRLQLQELVH